MDFFKKKFLFEKKIFLKKNFKFFFQIHKIYHIGLLCTNFQCSGIILIFFKFGPIWGRNHCGRSNSHSVTHETRLPRISNHFSGVFHISRSLIWKDPRFMKHFSFCVLRCETVFLATRRRKSLHRWKNDIRRSSP